MLGLSRSGLRRFSRQRRFLSAAVNVSDRGSHKTSHAGTRKNKNSLLPEEHLALQNKYKNTIVSAKDIKTLHDIVDLVEWRNSSVMSTTLNLTLRLLQNSEQKVTTLTDRELAVVISVFGEKADSTPKATRSEHLKLALEVLEQKGVTLGVQSRNAVLEAQLANGEVVNVVNILQEWESIGISPNEETYRILSKSYAIQGNAQGVIDIINHVKTTFNGVPEGLFENMVYAVAKKGGYEQAQKLVEKFSNASSDVRFRCAVASAAISRGDYNEAVDAIKNIPNSSKPNIIENNKYILNLYLDLLEVGKEDYANQIYPFLTTTQDGSTLTEWHHNSSVVSRIRRNRSEGLIIPALNMYKILHPELRTPNIEDLLRSSAAFYFRGPGVTLPLVYSICDKMSDLGIISNKNMFLLDIGLPNDLFNSHFKQIRSDEGLYAHLSADASKRYKYAKKLSQPFADEKSSLEDRANSLANIAIVCLAPSKTVNSAEFYPLLYKLGGYDMDLVIKTLKTVPQQYIRRELGTAFVQRLLSDHSDALAAEKLQKLLSSGAVRSLSLYRLERQLEKKMFNKNKEPIESNLKIISQIVAFGFPENLNAKMKDVHAVTHIVNLLKNETVTIETAKALVNFMEQEDRIAIPSIDLNNAIKTLRDLKQEEKANLLLKLKKKSTTYSRWLESNLSQLDSEWTKMTSSEKYSEDVIAALEEVICRKLLSEQPINYNFIVKYLTYFQQKSKKVPSAHFRIWQTGFTAALQAKSMSEAERLWNIRPQWAQQSADSALCYISYLFLTGNNADADKICEQLRSSAAIITGKSLENVGKMLNDDQSSKLNELFEYLSQKFALKAGLARRIIYPIKLREINKLIEQKEFTRAFNISCDESAVTGLPIGHFELFMAALENGDGALASNIHNLLKTRFGPNNAILDTSYAFLHGGRTEEAMKLLSAKGLTITSRKLRHYIQQSSEANRPDVLKGLFLGLFEGEKASTVDLNDLLLVFCKLHYKANNLDEIISIRNEVEKKSFPVDERIRSVFNNVEKQMKSAQK